MASSVGKSVRETTPVPSGTLLHAKRGGRNKFFYRLNITDMHTKIEKRLVLRAAVAFELGN